MTHLERWSIPCQKVSDVRPGDTMLTDQRTRCHLVIATTRKQFSDGSGVYIVVTSFDGTRIRSSSHMVGEYVCILTKGCVSST